MRYGLLFLLLASTLALADPDEAPLAGVWTGTLGKQAITACFYAETYPKSTGSYYYQRYLHPIDLRSTGIESGGIGTEWKEENGEWRLSWDKSAPRPDALGGTWTSPDKSRTLPITLTRVKEFDGAPVDDTWGCGNDAYLKAIEPSPKTLFSPEQVLNGVTYRKVSVNIVEPEKPCSYDAIRCMETIEIIGNTPAIQSINQQLREITPVSELASGLLDCWWASGVYYINTERIQTVDVSVIGSYLMLRLHNRSTCITSHPIAIWEDTYLWNLESGEREDLLSWFGDEDENEEAAREALAESVQDGEEAAQDALAEFVYGQLGIAGPDDDYQRCYGDLGPNDYMYGDRRYRYRHELSNSGIYFTVPSRSNGACGGGKEITFEKLWPFLNEKGKAEVARIRKSSAAREQ
jgi:hypothetical protein